MKEHREFNYGDLKRMAENPNPPRETRKPLFALEYSRKMKELGYGQKTSDEDGAAETHEYDCEGEQNC